MHNFVIRAALLAALLPISALTLADGNGRGEEESVRPLTIAVFGDWPYNQNLLTNAPLLIDSVNADRSVSLVVHVGDIHSGSMPCTSAGISPPIATSSPGWNQGVFYWFQQFEAPVVYTPGDNEWADCHKGKEFKSGAPLNELASVRNLFFARPGITLGRTDKDVLSQAEYYDRAYPTDKNYVENVMWMRSSVVFVTLNMPGSNNDMQPWTNGFEDLAKHAQEVEQRTAADIRWLDAAFAAAAQNKARAVVIALQADMWDPEAAAPGGDGLNAYTPFVQELAAQSLAYGRPVLLLNGDSHVYKKDRPLADPGSDTGKIHQTPAVPNLQRITVQGSTTAPAEWLRLTIDPRRVNPFSDINVPYCKDPLGSCT
jgi:hypothetical protein